MKLNLHSTLSPSTSGQRLFILVGADQLLSAETQYQFTNLQQAIEVTQFKASLNETLALIGQSTDFPNSALIGLDKPADLKPAKLAKIAQNIIKASQKKFKHISIDISALPAELHYLFALSLTQAAYAYDDYKSKKMNSFLNKSILFQHKVL